MGSLENYTLKYPVAGTAERIEFLKAYGFVLFRNKYDFEKHRNEEDDSAVLIGNGGKIARIYCFSANIGWKDSFKRGCRAHKIPLRVTNLG
jgi:hypothetical protein